MNSCNLCSYIEHLSKGKVFLGPLFYYAEQSLMIKFILILSIWSLKYSTFFSDWWQVAPSCWFQWCSQTRRKFSLAGVVIYYCINWFNDFASTKIELTLLFFCIYSKTGWCLFWKVISIFYNLSGLESASIETPPLIKMFLKPVWF